MPRGEKALDRDGPEVIGLLDTAAETFTGQAAISETLRDLAMQLAADHPPGDIVTPSGPVADLLADHRRRYTMDAERRIHEQLFGAEPVAAEPASTGSESRDEDLDALFF